ncbi:MAG: hypothetical protein V7K15_14105 [Nostoc sp.]
MESGICRLCLAPPEKELVPLCKNQKAFILRFLALVNGSFISAVIYWE